MNERNDIDREERALDALIIAAFLEDACMDGEKLNKKKLEASLTEEDKKALDSLGPDLVQRIMSGEWKSNRLVHDQNEVRAKQEEEDLLVAMNRGDADTGLSPEARREIEEKIREAEQELDSESDEEKS